MASEPMSPMHYHGKDNIVSSILIRATLLEDAGSMSRVLSYASNYFDKNGWATPPIRRELCRFVPSTLLISETYNMSTQERVGRIRILRDMRGNDIEAAYFDNEWVLRPKWYRVDVHLGRLIAHLTLGPRALDMRAGSWWLTSIKGSARL